MTEDTAPVSREQIYNFIRDEIDTIPHLEALLLTWRDQSRQWSVLEIAKELYVPEEVAHNVLQGLHRRGLLAAEGERYRYASRFIQRDRLIEALDATYRHELVPISRLIHSKGTGAIRDFADAFRFTKNKE